MLPITPSNLERRYLCPGSAAQEAAAPETSSRAADRGMRLHEVMAEIIENGQAYALERGDLLEADADAVRWTWEQVEPMIREAAYEGALVLTEHRLDLSALGIEPDDPERGRVDLAIVYPGVRAILVDFKFGRGFVTHPRWNWQFRAYATGLWQNFGGETVTAIKLQPAADEDARRQEYTFGEAEIKATGSMVRAVVDAAQADDAPLVPGTKQCQWCAAREICPARTGAVAALPRHLSVRDHLTAVSPADRAEFFEKLLVAEEWVSQAIATCQDWALDGSGQIPGWKVGEGRKSRAWKDPIAALPMLRESAVTLGKDPEQLVETSVISVAQAEKLIGKKAFATLEPLVEVKAGGPKLVREK